MADETPKTDFVYKWTSNDTGRFIRARGEADRLFTGQRNSAMDGWKQVLRSVDLLEKVTPQQARKKWDNLKKKYKELKNPPTGTGTDAGEDTAASWPWFCAMDEILGQRHSISPPVIRSSMPQSSSRAAEPCSPGAVSPPAEKDREPQGEARERGQKRSSFAAFLKEQFEREEAMEKERQKAADERFARLLAVLERMAEK